MRRGLVTPNSAGPFQVSGDAPVGGAGNVVE
jgi:hypothetical protein